MLDLVPLAGARRKWHTCKANCSSSARVLQCHFPQAAAAGVAAAAVGRDHQFVGPRKTLAAHLPPPAPDARRGEPRRVVINGVPTPSRPRRWYCAARPVAADTHDTPPHPRAQASAAAHWRRTRSSITGERDRYFCRIRSATIPSCMLASSSHHPGTQQDLLKLFFRGPLVNRGEPKCP